MAYVKNIWVDQDVERPKTYEVTNNQDGSITLTDSFGLVTELGTPVNEVNMNHIEDGIDGCAIRKHNLTETFNLGEWVLGGTGDDEGIYKSLVSNNVGNAITDDTAWEKVQLGGSSLDLFMDVTSDFPLTNAGLHLKDGSLIQYGSYSAFVDKVAEKYVTNPEKFTTEANWQAEVLATGFCDKYVYDSTNNTVRLPKIGNQLIHNLPSTLGVKGTGMSLGLSNGSQNVGLAATINGLAVATNSYGYNVTNSNYANTGGTTQGNGNVYGVTSDSSKSGIVAETNNINTADVYHYVVIATTTKTAIQVNIDEIATDLNGKADVDLTNVNNAGTSKGAGWAMPSDTFDELTVGASGTQYIAPANGYFWFQRRQMQADMLVGIINITAFFSSRVFSSANTAETIGVYIPALKGQTVEIAYNGNGDSAFLRFIYAQGSESEAS